MLEYLCRFSANHTGIFIVNILEMSIEKKGGVPLHVYSKVVKISCVW